MKIIGSAVLGLILGFVFYQGIANNGVINLTLPGLRIDYSSMPILTIVNDEAILKEAVKEIGIKKLTEKLVKESEGGSKFDCHQENHKIGRVGYDVYKEKAFQECDASCHSGCYHGAMEAFLNDVGTSNISEKIDSVCSLFKTEFEIFECLHGVGHGLLAYADYDMKIAVEDCKKLKDWFSTVSCYGGMFMENILTGQGLGASEKANHETKWVSDDPHFPCNALPFDDYDLRYQCYQMQTSWMLTLNRYNFEETSNECLNAPDNMIGVCFKSFGRDAAGYTLRNPQRIKEICSMVPRESNYYEECVRGAVNVIIDFWGPALKGQAAELCSILDKIGKDTCYRTLAWRIPNLFNSKEEKSAACEYFESEYKNLCANI